MKLPEVSWFMLWVPRSSLSQEQCYAIRKKFKREYTLYKEVNFFRFEFDKLTPGRIGKFLNELFGMDLPLLWQVHDEEGPAVCLIQPGDDEFKSVPTDVDGNLVAHVRQVDGVLCISEESQNAIVEFCRALKEFNTSYGLPESGSMATIHHGGYIQ